MTPAGTYLHCERVKSALIRKRSSIALASLLVLAIAGTPNAAGAAAGDLDPSFGIGGKVVTDFGGRDDATAIALQPNGKIIVGGRTDTGPNADFALARYTTEGFLDPIFDGDGKVTTDLGGSDIVWGLTFRPGGGIVAAGNRDGRLAVVRYSWDGSLDPTFGNDGTVIHAIGDAWYDVALQGDGKIVVVGCSNCIGNSDFIVARLNSDGSVDESFGEQGGWTYADFGVGDTAFATAVQSDGKIVVAGWTGETPEADFALARYDLNGVLDPTFDGDGKVTVDFGGLDHAYGVAIQSAGKIVVAGDSRDESGDFDFALARLNMDGSLDTQGLDRYMDAPFGVDGKVTTDFNGGEDQALSVAIEPSGKIVLPGLTEPAPVVASDDFGLARYNVDGSLDSSFGAGGTVTTSITTADDIALGAVVQRDGRIVAAGTADDGTSTSDFALARYLVKGCCTADGSPPGTVPEPPGPLPQ